MKVFITREIPTAGIDLLKKAKFKVSVYKKDKPISRRELLKEVRDCDAVISLLTDKFDEEIINRMENCRIIANYAVGYNNIDVEHAKRKDIYVTNTPDVLTDATADLAITLALACARRVPEGEALMRRKKFDGWKPQLLLGIELKDKIFGILGAGRIGTAAAVRAKAFGTKIIYFSKSENKELEGLTGAERIGLDELLQISDFVSIHLPLTEETYHLLDKKRLKLLKENCILINTARGEIVDEKELIKILKKKKIFAAGLDVYEGEPDVNSDLLKLDNAVLLPHLGSATNETRNRMAELAAENVIAVLNGKHPITPVWK